MMRFLRRRIRFWWQRRTRGWDDSDTWSLDCTAAAFLLPRLRRFKELTNGYPASLAENEWNEILDKIIRALSLIIEDEDYGWWPREDSRWDEYKEGMKLLGEWWLNLWW